MLTDVYKPTRELNPPWEVFHEIEHHFLISPFHKRDGAKMVESIDSSRIPPANLDMLRPIIPGL